MTGPRRPARRPSLLAAALAASLLVAAVALAPLARAQSDSLEGPAIPAPVGYVNDVAGALDEPTRAELEGFLDQVEKKTGAQFAILIVPTTEPSTPEDYKTKVFEKWGIGKKGSDEGLLMLVDLKAHAVRFETGYGLEGVLPDGLLSRIYREQMRPHFLNNDLAGGIVAGTQACAAKIAAEKGVTVTWNGQPLRYGEPARQEGIPRWAVALIFFVIITILNIALRSGRRSRFPWWIGPGFGGWGGWGGGGGGFGGGGFGGGGGGFGGFGGGASGGGGGGGGGGGSW